MQSKWYDNKALAIRLRKRGSSIRKISTKLDIPKSTLSGWFRSIALSDKQKQRLLKNWQEGLVRARKKAVLWHNQEKEKRLIIAKKEAKLTLGRIDVSSPYILDLALAMLYLGEGFKKNDETGIGNSDPLILKFFLAVLKRNYHIRVEQIRCELHLRADQDSEKMKKFWASELKLPIENFKYIYFDARTKNSKTFESYKGVCLLRCANVAIQRKLINVSKVFCERVSNSAVSKVSRQPSPLLSA